MSIVNNPIKEYLLENSLNPVISIYCEKIEMCIDKGLIEAVKGYVKLLDQTIKFTNIIEND